MKQILGKLEHLVDVLEFNPIQNKEAIYGLIDLLKDEFNQISQKEQEYKERLAHVNQCYFEWLEGFEGLEGFFRTF